MSETPRDRGESSEPQESGEFRDPTAPAYDELAAPGSETPGERTEDVTWSTPAPEQTQALSSEGTQQLRASRLQSGPASRRGPDAAAARPRARRPPAEPVRRQPIRLLAAAGPEPLRSDARPAGPVCRGPARRAPTGGAGPGALPLRRAAGIRPAAGLWPAGLRAAARAAAALRLRLSLRPAAPDEHLGHRAAHRLRPVDPVRLPARDPRGDPGDHGPGQAGRLAHGVGPVHALGLDRLRHRGRPRHRRRHHRDRRSSPAPPRRRQGSDLRAERTADRPERQDAAAGGRPPRAPRRPVGPSPRSPSSSARPSTSTPTG